MVVGKHLICQKLIVPYMKDDDNDILFTMKAIEMNFCRDVYGVRLYLTTSFEPGIARNIELNSSLMWISNRGHVVRVGGII